MCVLASGTRPDNIKISPSLHATHLGQILFIVENKYESVKKRVVDTCLILKARFLLL